MSPQKLRISRAGDQLPMLLLVTGCWLVLVAGSYWHQRLTVYALADELVAEYAAATAPALRPALPTQITLLGKTIPIEPQQYDGTRWIVSDAAASFLLQSARPGESGNAIIYGHNTPEIFRTLYDVKLSDEIVIWRADGSQRRYVITDIQRVEKTDTALVAPTQEEVLTLYTCIGWMDSERLVVQARPK